MTKIKPLHILIFLHVVMVLVAFRLLIKQKGTPPIGAEKIVVIPIDGVITMENHFVAAGQSVDSLVQTLRGYEKQDDIKAIVLRINSPGGSIGAVQEIYQALARLKSKGKIIVSSFSDVAASGGYYIACAGDKIVSNPGTITGSIGVVMQTSNVQGLLEKIGISMETIKSGQFKDAGSPFRKMTKAEREHFQTLILDAYDQFYTVVKDGRKLSEPELIPIADGRVFSGRMAHHVKLVDELGGLQDALELAKKLTNLTDKEPQIIFQKDRRSLDRIMKIFSSSVADDLRNLAASKTEILFLMK